MPDSPTPTVEHLPHAIVVHVLASHLGKEEVDQICNSIDHARLTAPMLPFIIDMAKVDFAGSLAMGVLIGLNKEFKTRNQRLLFVNIQPNLRQAISVVRMDRLIEIINDLPGALKALEPAT